MLVQIPDDAPLSQFGQILTDRGVVASVRAFTNAADGKPISAGFYKLRTRISAASRCRCSTVTTTASAAW